ncbi:SGNH/GDSL hydrolase family protein [Streptomyces sp. NPDC058195]|uniref:SGNH/GDSL hydrolase family protein n=1 Tax=Streptomyces sp. NPDC058195 TaxID=3346375 RepID=UPI0036EFEE9B
MFHLKKSPAAGSGRSPRPAGSARGGGFTRKVALGAAATLALATAAQSGASATPVRPPAPASAPATAPADDPAQWVMLGDSYTTGEFVGDPSPALDSPNRDGCDRTTGAYPSLVARRLAAHPPGDRPVKLTDVSCGGATIDEVTTERQNPVSPVQTPKEGWPSVAPQVHRAPLSSRTDVVTIGAGGNSLPFSKMLVSCLTSGIGRSDEAAPCRDAYEANGPVFDPESIHDKYDRVSQEYVTMLRDVHKKAPEAKVITVGYPTIVPADPEVCDRADSSELTANLQGVGRISVTHGDIAWLNGVNNHLNAIIRALTKLSGDTYVDIATPSVGHDACQPPGTKWVEGICGEAGPYWPQDLALGLVTLACSDDKRATLVHPNSAGHAETAALVEAAVRDALK